ncbi:MAG: histone deacetylase [Thermodesulfobacteriota bacterium]
MPLVPIVLISHPDLLRHDTGGGLHPEVPERLTAIRARLAAGPLAAVLREETSRAADWPDLLVYHDEAYLARFEEAALAGRSHLGHPDNQISYDSFNAALLAAGAGLVGIDLLEREAGVLPFCSVRPPGHHAERALALGFCFINNIVVAARYWQRRYGRRRLAVVDWDAHHGNGIQAAFETDPEVLYASIHEHPTFSFPGTGYSDETGTGPGLGYTLNVPLPPGAHDAMVLAALDEQLEPALTAFAPEGLIVAAGLDGHRQDDMSGLAYSTGLYRRLGERMAAWGRRYCQGRVLSILEGGYELEPLAASVEAYLLGLAEGE